MVPISPVINEILGRINSLHPPVALAVVAVLELSAGGSGVQEWILDPPGPHRGWELLPCAHLVCRQAAGIAEWVGKGCQHGLK